MAHVWEQPPVCGLDSRLGRLFRWWQEAKDGWLALQAPQQVTVRVEETAGEPCPQPQATVL